VIRLAAHTTMRRPIFYGDVAIYRGKVIRKYVVERTDAAGRTVPYAAVAVEIVGLDQRDEVHCLGPATVFLPSATTGRLALPVPHADRPDTCRSTSHGRAGWF
jgi:hypothetical protein